jgi:hypothetical protein
MKKHEVHLTEIFGGKESISNLVSCGFKTLRDCANAGNSELGRVRNVGPGTLRALRKHCHKNGITWKKSMWESVHCSNKKTELMQNYNLDDKTAEQFAEIWFIEGYQSPGFPKWISEI